MKMALEGIRVLDVSEAGLAPVCCRILADMGAEVIKVETRKRPDPVRFGPDNLARDPEMDPLFHSINRNKLGILLDLKTAEGIQNMVYFYSLPYLRPDRNGKGQLKQI